MEDKLERGAARPGAVAAFSGLWTPVSEGARWWSPAGRGEFRGPAPVPLSEVCGPLSERFGRERGAGGGRPEGLEGELGAAPRMLTRCSCAGRAPDVSERRRAGGGRGGERGVGKRMGRCEGWGVREETRVSLVAFLSPRFPFTLLTLAAPAAALVAGS